MSPTREPINPATRNIGRVRAAVSGMPLSWGSLFAEQLADHVLAAVDAFDRAAAATVPDPADGRCPVMLQCHRETGHEGGHEAREENTDA
jgi:hypothetical protein